MNVHLFGNGPSPAVSTYGLRRTVVDSEEEYGMEAKKFICRNFYVDDGLTSLSYTQGATDLVKSAQATLVTTNLRLHILVSNSVEVMEAFLGRRPPKRRAWSGITSRQLQLTSSAFARSILGPGDRCLYRQGIYSRRAGRRVQFLAEQFWTRWRREYLQSQSRDKSGRRCSGTCA